MIQAKATNIVAKGMQQYDPATFEQFKQPNFFECSAEYVLANIRPATFDFLPGYKFIDFDTETFFTGIAAGSLPANVVRRWIKTSSSKYIPNDFPFCISVCDGTNAFVVYDTLQNKFAEFKKLAPLLEDRSISKIGHNIDFDLHMLANAGVDLIGELFDSMVSAKLVRADAFSNRLVDIARDMPEGITVYEKMVDSYKSFNRITDYRRIPHDLMTQYTCADVWNSFYAFKHHYPLILENQQLELLNIENKIMRIGFSMERQGIPIDPDYEHILIPELTDEAQVAEAEIYKQAGCMFNINSGKQMEAILIKLGYGSSLRYNKPTDAMLAKGIVDGNVALNSINKDRMINEGVMILETINIYQKAVKLLNTFAVKLYEMRDFNNVVHCNFNPMEAKTGRFSVSMPSMQNMPRRKDSRVRGAFIAKNGYRLYDFDFQSQEAKVLAHYSKAPYLVDNINKGIDIHKIVAAIIFDCDYADVTKKQREIAKSVEFAITYGAGPAKVASMTGLSVQEARGVMKTYLRRIPEVDAFIKLVNKIAKERGFIHTILNRYVYVERDREYASVNYVIQGSSADSTKKRMIEVYRYLRANKYKTKIILQVHDSLLNMVADEEVHIVPKLKYLQEDYTSFRVPITVDVAVAYPTWRDKEDIKVVSEKPTDAEQLAIDNYDFWGESILEAVS